MAQLTSEELKKLGKGQQFNFLLPNNQLVPAEINPSQAPTIDVAGELYRPGSVLAGTSRIPSIEELTKKEQGGTTPRAIMEVVLRQLSETGIPQGRPSVYDLSTPQGQTLAAQAGAQAVSREPMAGASQVEKDIFAARTAGGGLLAPQIPTQPLQKTSTIFQGLSNALAQLQSRIATQYGKVPAPAVPAAPGVGISAAPPVTGITLPAPAPIMPAPTPTTPPITSVSSLFANTEIESLKKKIDEERATIKAGISAGGKTKILEEAFIKYGVQEEQDIVSNLNKEIFAAQEELRALPELIKTRLEAIGVTNAQLTALQAREAVKPREALARLLEVRGLSTERINQAIKMATLFANTQWEDKMATLDAEKFALEKLEGEYKNLKEDQRAFVKIVLDEKEAVASIAAEAMRNGAPTDVVQNIINSQDRGEAIRKVGQYGAKEELKAPIVIGTAETGYRQWDPTTKTWKEIIAPGAKAIEGVITGDIKRDARTIMSGTSLLRLADLSTKDNYRAKVAAELDVLKEEALKREDIIGVIRASAGGKEVSDTFLQNFEKGLNVIMQISDLQAAIEGEATGPIYGIIRSVNPYDIKAQQIKARLQAIVPNLARGVYGEVGVLTDNDVELYSRTLPSLRSIEDVRNAVLGITILSVQRSLENKIKTQAAFGRDVSGIEKTYTDVKNLAERTLAPIKAAQIRTELDNAFIPLTSGKSNDVFYSLIK